MNENVDKIIKAFMPLAIRGDVESAKIVLRALELQAGLSK